MKKKVLWLALMYGIVPVFAQSHISWKELQYNIADGTNISQCEYVMYGDTLIGENTYKQVTKDGVPYCGMRLLQNNQKATVYMYEQEKVYILYDFAWEKGSVSIHEYMDMEETNNTYTLGTSGEKQKYDNFTET